MGYFFTGMGAWHVHFFNIFMGPLRSAAKRDPKASLLLPQGYHLLAFVYVQVKNVSLRNWGFQ